MKTSPHWRDTQSRVLPINNQNQSRGDYLEMWNCRYLEEPENTLLKYKEDDSKYDLCETRKNLEKLQEVLKARQLLNCEHYVVGRICYRFNITNRLEKSTYRLKLIKKALLRYNEMNIDRTVSQFIKHWPDETSILLQRDISLPSIQMLQYVLVRLMGAARLLQQITSRCHQFALEHSSVRHVKSFNLQLPMIAVISRIWALCRHFKRSIIQHYNYLVTVKLKDGPTQWMSSADTLPEELGAWLLGTIEERYAVCDEIEDACAAKFKELLNSKQKTEWGDLDDMFSDHVNETQTPSKMADVTPSEGRRNTGGEMACEEETLGVEITRECYHNNNRKDKKRKDFSEVPPDYSSWKRVYKEQTGKLHRIRTLKAFKKLILNKKCAEKFTSGKRTKFVSVINELLEQLHTRKVPIKDVSKVLRNVFTDMELAAGT